MKASEKEPKEADLQRRDTALYAEKIRALHRQILPGIFPAFLCAACYALAVWNTLPHWRIVLWLLVQAAALGGRVFLYRSYAGIKGKDALQRWKKHFTLLTYLAGAAWGSTAFFLFPEKASGLQILLVFLVGGLATGAVGVYAVFVEIVVGYILLTLPPFIFSFLLMPGHASSRWMGLLLTLYTAAMIITARRVKESVTRALELAEDLKIEIGERRRAEAALEEARDNLDLRVRQRTAELSEANEQLCKLSSAIEQAAEMVVITNLEGRIEYVNPAAEKISGYSAHELLGASFQSFQAGEAPSISLDKIFQTLRAGKSWEGEVRNMRKSGASYLANMTLSAVYDAEGTMTHFAAIMRDVTDRKKLERDLLQASKLSSMGALVSGIAHELNTPLATILGFSEELVKEKTLSPHSKKYADWIIKESKRCAAIVRQLLKFSRRCEARTVTFDLNEALDSVLPLYQYQLQSDCIEVKTALHESPLPVSGNPERVQQALLNILENGHQALKTRDRGGMIRVKTERHLSEARISIANNGPAIPLENLKKIFDPFFTTKDIGEGTGLGLALSCDIIEAHHGRIQVENLEGGGVCFHLSLPLAQDAPVASDEESLECTLQKGLKILLVEDDILFCEWLVLMLRQEAAFVTTASNGLEAVRHLGERQFDLILSDLKMPEMNGIELCQWLEKHRPEYVKRFVLLTGVTDSNFNDFCQERNIPVLLKPVDKKVFIRTLCEVAGRTHVSKDLA